MFINFLSSQKKGELRKLGHAWGRRTSGSKSKLIYPAFSHLKECHQKKLDIRRMMACNTHCLSVEYYLQAQKLPCSS